MEGTINEVELDVLQNLFSLEAEEDTTEEVQEEEQVEEITEEVITNDMLEETEEESETYKVARAMISLGQLEDLVVEIDDKEIKLSEFKDIDEDTLKSIITTYTNEQKEEEEKNFIKVKGLTETQQNLINIIKEGRYSDLKEVFNNPENLREPWEGYDNTNENHNEQVYRVFLKHVQKMSEEDIEALVESSKKSLTLDVKAQDIVNAQRQEFKSNIESKARDLEKRNKEEEEKNKVYTKELSESFKSMDLKPEVVLSMVKTATVKDSKNETALSQLIEEKLKDPKTATELILFLTNKEIYDSKIESKTKLNEQIDYAKKVKIVRETKPNNKEEDYSTTTTEDALTDIFNFKN